ncbi:hypothetical protein C8R44DRAFT_889992 [Mycena epipterygia]|nr:hypothetical protein C8R44DRAFT_889992 [Mycena epipterygia]
MSPPLTRVPNEIWLRIFFHVADAKSLMAFNLTSRAFHDLGVEELNRTLIWNKTERTKHTLKFWRRNMHRSHIPTMLSMQLNGLGMNEAPRYVRDMNDDDYEDNEYREDDVDSEDDGDTDIAIYASALHQVLSFRNLGSLSLSQAWRHAMSPLHPRFFPLSFPSFSDTTIGPAGIGVTDLSIRLVLPAGRPFIFLDEDDEEVASPDKTPRISPPHAPRSSPPGSPSLVTLKITTPLANTPDALTFIEHANPTTLCVIELSLTEWDDEVLLAIVYRFTACCDIKLVFRLHLQNTPC